MQLSNFIQPKLGTGDLIQLDYKTAQLKKFIQEHCNEFLKISQSVHKPLYRGFWTNTSLPVIPKMNVYQEQAFISTSLDNRLPMSSRIEFQNKFDEILRSQRFIALRSNSTFLTSQIADAQKYTSSNTNNIFSIYPINGFTYTWSPHVKDAFLKSADIELDMEKLSPEKFIAKYNYKNSIDLNKALEDECEIMVRCKFIALRKKTYSKLINSLMTGH